MARSIRRTTLFLPALLILALALPATAVTVSGPTAALDNLPPEPASNVAAVAVAQGVEVQWTLSPSDGRRPAPTGDVTSGGTFVSVNDVAAYNVYVSENDGDFVLVGSAAPGDSVFVDDTAVSGGTLVYRVTALDASGNESAGADSGPVSLGPPPTLVLSPTQDVDFGDVDADSSATHVITVSNEATEANAVLSVTAAFGTATAGVSAAGFSVDPATVILQPGESAELTVTFSAADAGNFNGAYEGLLTLRSNDPDNSDVTIDFAATLVGGTDVAEIQVLPVSVNFSNRKIGTTASRQVTVSNLGGAPLTGTASVNGAGFSLAGGSFSLAGGESADITVSFSPTSAAAYSGTLTISSNDADEATVEIPLTGTGVTELSGPGTRVATVVKATLRVTDPVDLTDAAAVDAFKSSFRNILAQLLGVSSSRIRILGLSQGSTIVQFQIDSRGTATTEPKAVDAMTSLTAALADNTTDEFADLGGTESFVDETAETVLQPVDANGDAILGWFSFGASGSQVGFDDFFLFADHFGESENDANFDSIYDIAPADAPNGIVDFDDFFRFADDFGKSVANAEEIIAAAVE